MIDASLRHPTLAAALDSMMVRRRAPRIAPPADLSEPDPVENAIAPMPGWRDDLRFFLGCYAAALAFFLIILS